MDFIIPRGHRPKRGIAHKRAERAWRTWREENPLVIDRVEVPEEAVDLGMVTSFVCTVTGERDPDRPSCPGCGSRRDFYEERCSCGATKPWLFPDELPPGRARRKVYNF